MNQGTISCALLIVAQLSFPVFGHASRFVCFDSEYLCGHLQSEVLSKW